MLYLMPMFFLNADQQENGRVSITHCSQCFFSLFNTLAIIQTFTLLSYVVFWLGRAKCYATGIWLETHG